jgi:hypothetical protein
MSRIKICALGENFEFGVEIIFSSSSFILMYSLVFFLQIISKYAGSNLYMMQIHEWGNCETEHYIDSVLKITTPRSFYSGNT